MRTRNSKKQTRLSFEPVASSSPTVNSYNPAVQGRLANVRFQGARRATRSSKPQQEEPVRKLDTLPTPEPSSQPQTALSRDSSPLSDQSSTARTTPIRSNRSSAQQQEQESDEDEIVVPSSKRRRLHIPITVGTPTRKSTRLRQISTPDSNSSLRSARDVVAIASSPPAKTATSIGSAETSGDEEEILFTKPTKGRRGSRPAPKNDPFIVSDHDEDEIQVVSRTRARKGRAANDFVVDDDEVEYLSIDSDMPARQNDRNNSKNRRRNRTRQEQDELEDDLQNLQDSDQSDVVKTRTRGGPVTTQRDRNREHFELLRRRRAGEPVPRLVIDSEDEEAAYFGEDDGVDLDEITKRTSRPRVMYDDNEDHSSSGEGNVRGLEEVNDDAGDDDFIVEDESQPSRHPTAGIPLAFTSFASRKPRELFIHIIEWLIKNKIAPAFSRDDELYALSWNKINDQIKAQAGSRLISSAWTEDFKNAILARPHMQVYLVTEGHDELFLNCDACNRTNHPARYEFKFTGQAYNKDTLEPIDDDDSQDEDEDLDDSASYDQKGHLLPSSNRTYNLGRFCAANAEMGHKLTHWKYNLNQSLLEYLEEQGVLSAEAIVARDKLNKKKREKEAENIVDQMEETGMVDQLWRGLQDDLEDARFGMEDHVARGGRRNQQRIGKVRVDRGNGRIEEWSEGGRMKLVLGDDSEGE